MTSIALIAEAYQEHMDSFVPVLTENVFDGVSATQFERMRKKEYIDHLFTHASEAVRGFGAQVLARGFGVSRNTIYRWAGTEIKTGSRYDSGQRRCLVTLKWDKAFGAMPFAKRLADEIGHYAAGLYQQSTRGDAYVARQATARLTKLTLAALGEQANKDQVAKYCKLNKRWAQHFRQGNELVALYDTDRKKFNDTAVPRIRRNLDGLMPMDVVFGDVTPLDIYVDRLDADGKTRQATYRCISWLDAATQRLYVSLYLPPKGCDVTRMEVAQSFANMCQEWGLPRTLYLDNGSEYKWGAFIDNFNALARIQGQMSCKLMDGEAHQLKRKLLEEAMDNNPTRRALPYNAPAKTIESIFASFNPTMASISGYVGGDRQRKKTHNVGKAPLSFPGDHTELHRQVAVMVDSYNNKPKGKRTQLAGDSPHQRYQIHIDKGWKKTQPDKGLFSVAFADEYERKVQAGKVQVARKRKNSESVFYYADELLPLRSKVTVRISPLDPRIAYIVRDGKFFCVAMADIGFEMLDKAGAKEKARRMGLLKRLITEKRHPNCDRLSLIDEEQAANELFGIQPQAEVGRTVHVTGEMRKMLTAFKESQLQQAQVLLEQKPIAARTSQWSVSKDPLVQQFEEQLTRNDDQSDGQAAEYQSLLENDDDESNTS